MTIATTEVLEGQIVDREALLDSIAEYAQWLQKAERLVQAKSLEKAADLWTLYTQVPWAAEWQEVEPARATDALGKSVDPANRNRFAKWLAWAEARRGKPTISSPRVGELLNAHEVVSVLPAASRSAMADAGVTERAVRPLNWLKRTGYTERIPEVWDRATNLAAADEEAERVTQRHVKDALNEFKGTLTPKLQRQLANTPRAQTLRSKAQAAVEDLWKTGNQAEAKKFYDWFVEFMRAQQDAA